MKALEKDRNRRYQSASNLAEDIERYLAGESIKAAPPSRRYTLMKFARRHRGPVVAMALLSLTLLAVTAWTACRRTTRSANGCAARP